MKRLIGAGLAALFLVPGQASSASQVDSVFPRGLPHAYTAHSCASQGRCVWSGDDHSYILTPFRGEYLVQPISNERARLLQVSYCHRSGVDCGGYAN